MSTGSQDEAYADWYVWAKRNLSTDSSVCHAAAAAATAAEAAGATREQAIEAARRSFTTGAHAVAGNEDIRRRTYAEWFDWARRELGGVREQQHAAAAAALRTLDAGQGANIAMANARAASGMGQPEPAPAPAAPPPPPPPPPAPPPPGSSPAAYPPPAYAPPGYGPPAYGPPGYVQAIPQAPARPSLYGGFWRRLLAFLIDVALWVFMYVLVSVGIGFFLGLYLALTGQRNANVDSLLNTLVIPLYVVTLTIAWLYFTIAEITSWQGTLGKLVVGLKVVDEAGRRISFGRANARYWSKLISFGLLGIGFLLIAFTERKQGLHDVIAHTLVVKRHPPG